MDHQQVTQQMVVERYLLEELSPEERDKFEQHFFDCQDCALDLRATAGFIDGVRKELQVRPLPQAEKAAPGKLHRLRLQPALTWAALAACLLVIAYQNAIIYPRFKTEIAQLSVPQILPSLSLVNGNSRGGQIPAITVAATQAFLLSFDVPAQDRYSSYTCVLYSPSGAESWRVEVSAQAAKDTVSVTVPFAGRQPGEYSLAVQGNGTSPGNGTELARYRFTLNTNHSPSA